MLLQNESLRCSGQRHLLKLQLDQSCFVGKETTGITVTRGTLWSEKSIIILALLNKFVYDCRGNNTYVTQEKTALALIGSKTVCQKGMTSMTT